MGGFHWRSVNDRMPVLLGSWAGEGKLEAHGARAPEGPGLSGSRQGLTVQPPAGGSEHPGAAAGEQLVCRMQLCWLDRASTLQPPTAGRSDVTSGVTGSALQPGGFRPETACGLDSCLNSGALCPAPIIRFSISLKNNREPERSQTQGLIPIPLFAFQIHGLLQQVEPALALAERWEQEEGKLVPGQKPGWAVFFCIGFFPLSFFSSSLIAFHAGTVTALVSVFNLPGTSALAGSLAGSSWSCGG